MNEKSVLTDTEKAGADRFLRDLKEFVAKDPHVPTLMDVVDDIVIEGERPHVSAKAFGMRTFTQVGPVGRAILLAVHDRLHGIDRSEDYELDKKKGVLVLKKGRS